MNDTVSESTSIIVLKEPLALISNIGLSTPPPETAQSLVEEVSKSALAQSRLKRSDIARFLDLADGLARRRVFETSRPLSASLPTEELPNDFALARTRCQPHFDLMAYIDRNVNRHTLGALWLLRAANTLTPIGRLPFEVLGRIFTECVLLGLDEGSLTPLSLASVCAAWRDVAFRTPSVWSKVPICIMKPRIGSEDLDTRGIKGMHYARMWIARSGVTPLYFCVKWVCDRPRALDKDLHKTTWLTFMSSFAHRIVHIYAKVYYTSGNVPLFVDVMPFCRTRYPRLQSFSFHIHHCITELTTSWPFDPQTPKVTYTADSDLETRLRTGGKDSFHRLSIKALDGANPIPDLMFTLLPMARTSLCSMTLNISDACSQLMKNLPTKPIELPNLSEFRIQRFLEFCALLPKILTMPALTSLSILGSFTNQAPSGRGTVTALLNNERFPSLRHFALENLMDVDAPLQKFLYAHPELTSLTLCRLRVSNVMTALQRRPGSGSQKLLCPRLEHLDVEACGGPGNMPATIQNLAIRRYMEVQSLGSGVYAPLVSLKWEGEEQLQGIEEREGLILAITRSGRGARALLPGKLTN